MKTLVSRTAFIFQRSKTQFDLATAPFETLEPTFNTGVSAAEKEDVIYSLAEYQAGEEFKHPTLGVIVLGPVRPYTHAVHLHAVGNPDHGQYADLGSKKIVRCTGIDAAIKIVREYQALYDMGGGNCSRDHGTVYELKPDGKRKKIGKVCYGGRYDTLAEIKAWEAEMEAKYGKRSIRAKAPK
jgi:hypothetical protein